MSKAPYQSHSTEGMRWVLSLLSVVSPQDLCHHLVTVSFSKVLAVATAVSFSKVLAALTALAAARCRHVTRSAAVAAGKKKKGSGGWTKKFRRGPP